MKIGSLFDGSGGFPLAATMCGIEPVWASEIDPYPIAVTRSRFPGMKHLGSVTDIKGNEIEPVDVITFGSPCQDLSVAGKRAGLKHTENGDEETTRSGLFMEAIRIIKEMREATNGAYPRFAVWENVPGAFSSSKGEDFRIVLEEFIKVVEPTAVMPTVPKNGWPYADSYCGDGWSLSYRVLDAQFWGVPQRRRRIYLVADFRGQRAGKILFEREGLRGDFAQSRSPWESLAGDAESGIGAADREGSIPYTLKIRSGCAVDSAGKAAGKGALIQINKAATLAVAQDQYLFQPITLEPGIAAREGGHIYEGVSGTLRANAGDNQMAVAHMEPIAVATQQGGAEVTANGVCPTITAAAGMSGNNQPWICKPVSIENHPADSRVNIDDSGKVQTLTSRMGTGGGNVPMVMEPIAFAQNQRDEVRNLGEKAGALQAEPGMKQQTFLAQPVYCLQGNGIDRADTAGCNGKGVREDVCYTLNTIDRPAVCYAEPVTVHGEQVSGTLMSRDYKGAGRWDSLDKVVCQPICVADHVTPKIDESGVAYTLNARDYKDPQAVVYENPIALDRAFFNQGQNAAYTPQFYTDGTVPTLVAKGPSAVAVRYIVRRLTPTECARLQGFPDTWGHPDSKDVLSDEEYNFWLDVRNTHAAINGKVVKDYTKAQMLTWYNKLHTDSSEYKMWGNGIALPCALYVMQGIAEALVVNLG